MPDIKDIFKDIVAYQNETMIIESVGDTVVGLFTYSKDDYLCFERDWGKTCRPLKSLKTQDLEDALSAFKSDEVLKRLMDEKSRRNEELL